MNYYIIPGLKNKSKLPLSLVEPQVIMETICRYFGTDIDVLFKKSRKKEVVMQRHLCQYFLMLHSPLSCTSIAKMFDQDHTTVLHARDTIAQELNHNFDNIYKVHSKQILNLLKDDVAA